MARRTRIFYALIVVVVVTFIVSHLPSLTTSSWRNSESESLTDLWYHGPFWNLKMVSDQQSQKPGTVNTNKAAVDGDVGGAILDNNDFKHQQQKIIPLNKEQRVQRVNYMFQLLGSNPQKGFSHRPPAHQFVEGVLDPKNRAEIEKHRNNYNNKLDELRESKRKQRVKKEKENEERKKKEEETRRQKAEENRKAREKQKQEQEAKLKQEERKKQREELKKLQEATDKEGQQSDPGFLKEDMKHLKLNPDKEIKSKFKGNITLITVTGQSKDRTHDSFIKRNREKYCKRHGYKCSFIDINSIVEKRREKWFIRDGLLNYLEEEPSTDWVWYLSSHALITNFDLAIGDHILNPDVLTQRLSYGSKFRDRNDHYDINVKYPESLESVDQLNMIIARGPVSFTTDSFLIRNSQWARFWLGLLDDHLVAEKNGPDKETATGDILHYLFLSHETMREKVGVVTRRLLVSVGDNENEEYKKWQYGDLVVSNNCVSSNSCKEYLNKKFPDTHKYVDEEPKQNPEKASKPKPSGSKAAAKSADSGSEADHPAPKASGIEESDSSNTPIDKAKEQAVADKVAEKLEEMKAQKAKEAAEQKAKESAEKGAPPKEGTEDNGESEKEADEIKQEDEENKEDQNTEGEETEDNKEEKEVAEEENKEENEAEKTEEKAEEGTEEKSEENNGETDAKS